MSDKIFNEVRLIPPVQIITTKKNGVVIIDAVRKRHHFTKDGSYDGFQESEPNKQ